VRGGRDEEAALVIVLATLTEDRTPDEQRALSAWAARVDTARASFASKTISPNGRVVLDPDKAAPVRPWLFDAVWETYEPDEGRRLREPKTERAKVERAKLRFDEATAETSGA